jgi:hypothetical protein
MYGSIIIVDFLDNGELEYCELSYCESAKFKKLLYPPLAIAGDGGVILSSKPPKSSSYYTSLYS